MEGEKFFTKPLEQVPEQEKKTYEAEIFCTRCGGFIEKKPGFEKEGMISHSLHPECAKKEIEEARKEMEDFKRKNNL